MKTFNFILNEQELSIISDALGKMPFVQVFQLIESLKNQIVEQSKKELANDPASSQTA